MPRDRSVPVTDPAALTDEETTVGTVMLRWADSPDAQHALAELARALRTRAQSAWAKRTEADKAGQAALRDSHEAEYRTICAVLGDQALLSSTLGIYDPEVVAAGREPS